MLVRSPLLTSHKWRELVSSGRLVCRCHDVFLWCYLCLVLLRFRPYAFVEAAAFRLIVLRYAGAPIATRVFILFLFGEVAFSVFVFFLPLPFSLCLESTSYVLSFKMLVFFYLVTTGWIFDISSCENSINQSINHTKHIHCRQSAGTGPVVLKVVRVTGAAFPGFIMVHFFMRLSFPTPTIGI